ncbi:MAG: hypothetical protein O3C40_19835 [Planctomycetota bacterium]|nr:hypothetical protein [Planctomycetota bacterium]
MEVDSLPIVVCHRQEITFFPTSVLLGIILRFGQPQLSRGRKIVSQHLGNLGSMWHREYRRCWGLCLDVLPQLASEVRQNELLRSLLVLC